MPGGDTMTVTDYPSALGKRCIVDVDDFDHDNNYETLYVPTDEIRPPPDLIDDQEEYEVESILDHKHGKRRRQYLVKWKGYPLSETSWQSRSDLRHARDVVLAYEASLT